MVRLNIYWIKYILHSKLFGKKKANLWYINRVTGREGPALLTSCPGSHLFSMFSGGCVCRSICGHRPWRWSWRGGRYWSYECVTLIVSDSAAWRPVLVSSRSSVYPPPPLGLGSLWAPLTTSHSTLHFPESRRTNGWILKDRYPLITVECLIWILLWHLFSHKSTQRKIILCANSN